MLILLSPAKTLDFESPSRTSVESLPPFLDHSTRLVDTLRKYKPKRLGKLMNISEPLAELNAQRFAQWQEPYPADIARPSIQAFRGDVYVGLDADTMKSADLKHANKHIRILSGLYGVLKPLDLMLPYRLEMGTQLKTRRGKNLYDFWGERITKHLNTELESFAEPVVVNLASNEYFKSVRKKSLQAPLVCPVFKDQKNGEYKVISFFAKKARGAMARYLVDQRSLSVDALNDFDYLGYKYNKKDSTPDAPVFKRTEKVAQKYGPGTG